MPVYPQPATSLPSMMCSNSTLHRAPAVLFRGQAGGLQFLVGVLLVDALGARGGAGGALLVKLGAHGSVELFFKDGLGFDGLELGLEVSSDVSAGVASTTWIGQVVAGVFDLVTLTSPTMSRAVSNMTHTREGWVDVRRGTELKGRDTAMEFRMLKGDDLRRWEKV
jgi:hypothetical protein